MRLLHLVVCAALGSLALSSSVPERTPPAALPDRLPERVEPERTPEPRSPALLSRLLDEHDRLMAEGRVDEAIALRSEIDRVAAQRDAFASRLYWYTDLEQAKAEAKRTGRPIVSLHLLGKLDEELSCANSRLFRIALYSDPKVSALLRERYVMHWTSERPVPQITLDFGDGRVIKRTITGNSIHYVLDSDGRLVDAIPGLYGPSLFMKKVDETLALAQQSGAMTEGDSQKAIATHHLHMLWRLTAQWRNVLRKSYPEQEFPYAAGYIEKATLPGLVGVTDWPHPLYSSLPAIVVNELTISKASVEDQELSSLQPRISVSSSWGPWERVAKGLPSEHLDPVGRALVRARHPRDFHDKDARPLTDGKLDERISYFEKRLGEEEWRNEYVFHGAIHGRLSVASRVSLEPVNAWVYDKVFMTPQSDAWLGLTPTDALTGIAEDGLVR